MKLVTFLHHAATHVGAMISRDHSDFVFDLCHARADVPKEMTAFLALGDTLMPWAQNAIAAASARDLLRPSDVSLLAPVPRPGKIICIGHNYRDHTGANPPQYPDVFAKFSNVIIGPHQPIILPSASQMVDYEAEVGVVIGKPARGVQPAAALGLVAGYTIFNDVTARDYQKRQSQWTIGKSFDTFGPMGPALVTADEIGDPGNLDLTLWVNGEMRQHSNTQNLIFSIPFLISYLSQVMTLQPGDVIATGTPSGTGSSRKPPVFLQAGDEIRIGIERIGELMNPVVNENS